MPRKLCPVCSQVTYSISGFCSLHHRMKREHTPTPNEIRKRAAEIRATWGADRFDDPQAWSLPVVSTPRDFG